MSGVVRFASLDLDYGCHHGGYRFPVKDAPTVVLGPNGSGKSTLVDALVRTIYGFNRRELDARRAQEHRRPWKGGRFRARVTLEDAEGRLSIERAFESNHVVVRRLAADEEIFRGEANPAAPSSHDQQAYRKLLRELFGLTELGDYERTACIRQGHLLGTELAQDLLRIAAGGHADVNAAGADVRDEYYTLTLQPITSEERRRHKAGRVEQLEEGVEELSGILSAVLRAEADRQPLQEEERHLQVELSGLRSDVRRLEVERDALSKLRGLEEREAASRERIRHLEDVDAELREATWKVEAAASDSAGLLGEGAYPPDYLERLVALEEALWPRLRELEAKRDALAGRLEGSPAGPSFRELASLGLGVALLIGGLTLSSRTTGVAAMLMGVALLVLGVRGIVVRRRAGRLARSELKSTTAQIADVEGRIGEKLDGLSDPVGWAARARLEDGRGRLDGASRRAERTLRRDEEGAGSRVVAEPLGGVVAESKRLLTAVEQAISAERNDVMAPTRLALERERAEVERLPRDVRAAFRETDRELQDMRTRLEDGETQLREVQRRLIAVPRPEESSLALEARRQTMEEDLQAARGEARAYSLAYELLVDAYEGFRATDQERLVEHIDARLAALGGGELGPLAVPDDLSSAELRYAGRTMPLASPPLSYGELHVALFAIRIGSADFLSGLGVRIPLLVDDPFVHLDPTRAGEIWEVLCRVARERQVLVMTQDRLTLEHLGVRPDLNLDGPEREVSAQIEPPVAGPRSS